MRRTGLKPILGDGGHKLSPKLRMIADGSSEVNTLRAEQCGALGVTRTLLKRIPRRGDGEPVRRAAARPMRAGRLKALPSGVLVNVFIQFSRTNEFHKAKLEEYPRRGNLLRARVPVAKLPEYAADPNVTFVEIGESLVRPRPRLTDNAPREPRLSERRFGSAAVHHDGEGVLVGIIDVGGFDFAHPDFLDDKGETRWLRIWDQGGQARPAPQVDSPMREQFAYGAEFRREHLNAAIKAAPRVRAAATDLEPQSQMEVGSHGTHVASIAAGNRGLCRKAMIAGVLLALPSGDEDRRASFYDSTQLADAVDYLVELSKELSKKLRRVVPLSINISLGTNGHAHDGSSPIVRWIDSLLTKPGRCVAVAAGNAGQERAATPGDIGWVVGRIHTGGQVPAPDLNADIEWVVVGDGIRDISENEMTLWFSPQDRFAVSVRPPGMKWLEPVEPRGFIENRQLPDGTFVSVYNELYHPANGANCISIFLSPQLRKDAPIGVQPGTWTVRLHGRHVRDGRYHGWIERDDPRPIGPGGDRQAWAFPSFFSERSCVDNSTASSLACGQYLISVANLDQANNRINITSSQGPTRDGRCKPDIAAPGTNVVAAKGFADRNDLWVAMSGTSMASPFVTGLAGLMLAIEPRLTSAQILGILQRTAQPLPGASFKWADDAGFGAIQPDKCLEEARLLYAREEQKP